MARFSSLLPVVIASVFLLPFEVHAQVEPSPPPMLRPFRSMTDLRGFLAPFVREKRIEIRRMYGPRPRSQVIRHSVVASGSAGAVIVSGVGSGAGAGQGTLGLGAGGAFAGSASSGPSITNNQVSGVDEGDIVKALGDFLIVLRRGRLFSIRIGGTPTPQLRDVFELGGSNSSAIGEGESWYDELLTHRRNVYVIGYSYPRDATEIQTFALSATGDFSRTGVHFMRTGDYYSSQNYASRIVGDELILYAPHALIQETYDDEYPRVRVQWPRMASARDRWFDVLDASRVYRPVQPLEGDVTLHSVTRCSLSAVFRCSMFGIIAPSSRSFYVSNTGIYLWIDRHVYRIPLNRGNPGVVQVRGAPVDQFSFDEKADVLRMFLTNDESGDGMWRAEVNEATLGALATIPLSQFTTSPRSLSEDAYTRLPVSTGRALVNRFVGDHLLFGLGNRWRAPRTTRNETITVVDCTNGRSSSFALPHPADRIEPLGSDGLVVGGTGEDLRFTRIDLDGAALPRVQATHSVAGANQSETRSHGFFHHDGVLGLPITAAHRAGYEQLQRGAAAIVFLQADDAQFGDLGRLEASSGSASADDRCIVSCADWYGNARPIFWRNRIFALMGYELVEGRLGHRSIEEATRFDFVPRFN